MSKRLIIAVLGVLFAAGPAGAGVIFSDDFENFTQRRRWRLTSSVRARGAGQRGFDTGNALHYTGNGFRSATTRRLDVRWGGTISFDYRGGNEDIDGSFYWEDQEQGEDAVLEYSLDGFNFVAIDTLDLIQFTDDSPTTTWLRYTARIPVAAYSRRTRFRWRQGRHSGWGWDNWAIDNVLISSPEPQASLLIGLASIIGLRIRRRRKPLTTL